MLSQVKPYVFGKYFFSCPRRDYLEQKEAIKSALRDVFGADWSVSSPGGGSVRFILHSRSSAGRARELVARIVYGEDLEERSESNAGRLLKQYNELDLRRANKAHTALCYKYAYEFVQDNPGWELVHGTAFMTMGGHAWAEKDGYVYDPTFDKTYRKDNYYHDPVVLAHPTISYTAKEAKNLFDKSEHYGPWNYGDIGWVPKWIPKKTEKPAATFAALKKQELELTPLGFYNVRKARKHGEVK